MGEHRCDAITTKGYRCKKKADYYRKYDDGREYLCCKQHDLYFRPHPAVVRRKMEAENGKQ